jgi:hypothetical protein
MYLCMFVCTYICRYMTKNVFENGRISSRQIHYGCEGLCIGTYRRKCRINHTNVQNCFIKKFPPHTPAGFDLTIQKLQFPVHLTIPLDHAAKEHQIFFWTVNICQIYCFIRMYIIQTFFFSPLVHKMLLLYFAQHTVLRYILWVSDML